MTTVKYGNNQVDFELLRTDRKKTVSISVDPLSRVTVRAPDRMTLDHVQAMVKKRIDWIAERQKYFNTLSQTYPPKEFVSGETIFICGRPFRLKVHKCTSGRLPNVKLRGRRIHVCLRTTTKEFTKNNVVKKCISELLFQKAQEKIPQRVKKFERLLNVSVKNVIIKEQKNRWGSCSANGELRFNWRIIQTPISIIDYVVVHELCHLKEPNHSKKFWDLLSLFISDYKGRQKWLRENIGILSL